MQYRLAYIHSIDSSKAHEWRSAPQTRFQLRYRAGSATRTPLLSSTGGMGMETKLSIRVTVSDKSGNVVARYVMDHNDTEQRRVLGMQCRNAFEAGQSVFTQPISCETRGR